MRTIEYKVSYENMISRIPGLFAFIEENEVGEMTLYKATYSKMGCYGKVVQNIKIPENINLKIDDETLIETGKVYSYRTLIRYYYDYRDQVGEDDPFIEFMNEGIGKEVVPDETKNGFTRVPNKIFLSDARRLYNELIKLERKVEFYEKNMKLINNGESEYCCLKEKYESFNPTVYKGFLKERIDKAEEIADKFYGYAQQAGVLSLNFSVDLTNEFQDFGLLNAYIGQWMPYKAYYCGDKVFYDGKVYICTGYTTGKWDEEQQKVVFDNDHFVEYKYNEEEYVEKVSCKDDDNDEEDEELKEIIIDTTLDNVVTRFIDEEELKEIDNEEEKEEIIKNGGIVYKKDEPLMLNGVTDSSLTALRRFATYTNLNGVAERPSFGEDWLFYYRKGLVLNVRTLNDKLGNIITESGVTAVGVEGAESTDLAAYGDVIQDITVDNEKMEITFEYRIGAHLKATYVGSEVDDDCNERHNWKKFEWDDNEHIGMKYEETYTYLPDSDLKKLINGEIKHTGYKTNDNGIIEKDKEGELIESDVSVNFNKYIVGDYDKQMQHYKFEFVTKNNMFDYDKTIARNNVHITSLLSNFEVYRNNFQEFMESEMIRYDYFNGITYRPTKDINVNILRGTTSVFDRHLTFSEVKTLDDMVTHKNGSSFPMLEN